MLDTKPTTWGQYYVRYAGLGLIAGILLWITLLIRGAHLLRDHPEATRHVVEAGPFPLNVIERHVNAQGYTVSFSLDSGWLWYLLAWMILGGLVGITMRMLTYAPRARPEAR